ncbi:MAG: Methyltransferase domain [Solirubrobacteraceae bacterium]|nr:Methyltransferase domain [Solirubrobacteraceae bacterium]
MKRDGLRRCAADARFLLALRVLPPSVALFFLRAWRYAHRRGDEFSLSSSIRPSELAALLRLARGRQSVVELGTGTGWSAIALALADRKRRVVTYDPCARTERDAYLARAWPSVRTRIELRHEPDSTGPRGDEDVELLFIDSSHDRDSVVTAFHAWHDSLLPGAIVVFHDYEHPGHPGVRDAVVDLGLDGQQHGGLYVWRAP